MIGFFVSAELAPSFTTEINIIPLSKTQKLMPLDPQKEKEELKEYITRRIVDHPSEDLVYFIEAGFQFDQAGWFCLFLDTRANAAPDGQWTTNIEGNSIARPTWLQESENTDENTLGTFLGELIKESLLELRDEGIFEKLNKSSDCELGIEELSGWYGWPNYEDRKKENLA